MKTLYKVETLAESIDGRWYTMRILPYRTREDRIDGVVITFLDITESRVAKVGLEKAHADLENRVAQRTSDLADANASLWLEVSERRQAESSRVKLLNQLVTSQEKERQRFARDLHDQLGQQLTILRLKLETLKDESGQRQKLSAAIEEILGVLSHLDSDIDFLAWELRPIILDDLGLKEALRLYVDRWKEHSGIAAEFHSTGFNQDRLPVETENNLYRITQEALNNVAKHSNGSRVSVLLERRDDHAVLIIEDNGQGFKADGGFDFDSGFGLTGMRERALLIGASFEVESNAEKGTTIFVRAPLVSEGGGRT
jgi:signal transduction histidine kinase